MVTENDLIEAKLALNEYMQALLALRKHFENGMIEILSDHLVGEDTYVLRKIERLKNDSDSILLLVKDVEEQYRNVKKDLEDYRNMDFKSIDLSI